MPTLHRYLRSFSPCSSQRERVSLKSREGVALIAKRLTASKTPFPVAQVVIPTHYRQLHCKYQSTASDTDTHHYKQHHHPKALQMAHSQQKGVSLKRRARVALGVKNTHG